MVSCIRITETRADKFLIFTMNRKYLLDTSALLIFCLQKLIVSSKVLFKSFQRKIEFCIRITETRGGKFKTFYFFVKIIRFLTRSRKIPSQHFCLPKWILANNLCRILAEKYQESQWRNYGRGILPQEPKIVFLRNEGEDSFSATSQSAVGFQSTLPFRNSLWIRHWKSGRTN